MTSPAPTPRQFCDACGYEATGGTADVCPECGEKPRVLTDRPRLIWRSWRVAFVVVGAQLLAFEGAVVWAVLNATDPLIVFVWLYAIPPALAFAICMAPAFIALFLKGKKRQVCLEKSRVLLWGFLLATYVIFGLMVLGFVAMGPK